VRLSFLDSIRGVASLIVVTSHIHYATRRETWFLDTIGLRFFDQFVFAVAIFFVLSEFVLYLQIESEKIGYLAFVIRRIFRIFPACIFTVICSYAIYLMWAPNPLPSRGDWFNDVSWPHGIPFMSFIGHIWLNGEDALLRPIWSLVVEWRVSLIFPALVLLFSWSPGIACFAFGGISLIIALMHSTFLTDTVYDHYLESIFYISFFMLGIFIAANRLQIILLMNRWPRTRNIIAAICLLELCFLPVKAGHWGNLFQGVFSGLIIVVCMSQSKVRYFLRSPFLRFFGRISYSLYLVHILWIGILFRVLDGENPLLISGLVLGMSILSAVFLNRIIEAPFNKLGRMVARSIKNANRLPPPALAWPRNRIVSNDRNID
jgi:peptidoglycan/LPS O-acetylase OafA/YrhL